MISYKPGGFGYLPEPYTGTVLVALGVFRPRWQRPGLGVKRDDSIDPVAHEFSGCGLMGDIRHAHLVSALHNAVLWAAPSRMGKTFLENAPAWLLGSSDGPRDGVCHGDFQIPGGDTWVMQYKEAMMSDKKCPPVLGPSIEERQRAVVSKLLLLGKGSALSPESGYASWDAMLAGYQFVVTKEEPDADWYIQVTSPGGVYDYDGYWPDSESKAVSEALLEAVEGVLFVEDGHDL